MFSPHCSSLSTQTTAHLKTPLSSSWSLPTTLITLIGLILDGDESPYRQEVKELAVWCSLNNLELNTLKTVEMFVDFRRNPHTLSPRLSSWIALRLQWSHLGSWAAPSPRTWSGTITLSHCEKGPAETVLPSPAEEVQPATGAAETVLICHLWIRPLHINNCLVQLSYQIWPQKTTEGSPNYWANNWYILPTLQELYSSRVSKRAVKITLDPSHQHTHSLNCSTLQSSEHQNDQTQEQFLTSGNPSHEHLTLIMVHTLFIHLFI